MSTAAPRVVRGWIAASVCSWTAFAAHAQATPTVTSLVVMALITCVSAVIAMMLLSRRFGFLATSVVVLLSQGLYHLSLSVMSAGDSSVVAQTGSGAHAHHVMSLSIAGAPKTAESDSMILAHLLAAAVSIFLLRHGERMACSLADTLSLGTVRRLLSVVHRFTPSWPRPATTPYRRTPILSRDPNQRPLLRAPPSTVLNYA